MKIRLLCVAGARPNFMKIAPLMRAFAAHPQFDARLVHTGQHYDAKLSQVFFDELGIPTPDVSLGVGSGSHAQQTADLMRAFEPVVEETQPHGVLVVGDVNSTVACSLVAAKMPLREEFSTRLGGSRRRPLLIHVEAGLRSFDMDMPEEINRKLTDSISDLLYVSEPAGVDNLAKEGVIGESVQFVGNVMIDTLIGMREKASKSTVLQQMGLRKGEYAVVTLHRPSNVDDPAVLGELVRTLDHLGKHQKLVFPVHPRTRARLQSIGLELAPERWLVTEPLGYLDFLALVSNARLALTDSGGIQEETTVLGVPCLTLRANTERPVTVDEGTNQLVGTDPVAIQKAFDRAISGQLQGRIPRYWDGKAAERIAAHLLGIFN